MIRTFVNCVVNGRETSVALEDGVIRQIGGAAAGEKIDCKGGTLLPGVIDSHVHFREPGNREKEDFESGGRAAAKGGVTTVLDMPNTNPPTTSVDALEAKRKLAKKSVVNVGLYLGATADNLAELQKSCGAVGIKITMGSTTGGLLLHDIAALERVFRETDLPLVLHAENEARLQTREKQFADRQDVNVHSEIRDAETATLAVRTAIDLAEKTQHPAHLTHISTAEEVELIRTAKRKGIPVTCDVTPHHLFLTTDDYERLGTLARVNPPLREIADQEALWSGLRDGTIDCIATDHAPHLLSEKQKPYREAPSGIPGVETSLPLMLNAVSGKSLALDSLIELMSTRPAEIFRLGRKGKIEEGWDADLVLVDLEKIQEVRREDLVTKCGWSPFEGMRLTGWPVMTIIGGRIEYDSRHYGQTK
ncbi:MAG: dihydroorotase [Candidatus Kerfeldbacteria bacterium]|nr:dihydroorotase [Candidatus Kerfeldbacteria bacterium]